jgi:hypothetical protein
MFRPIICLLAMLALGCTGSDISQDPPIQTTDAAPGTVDASEDTPDGSPDTPDAAQPPDASPDRAQDFCDRYETLCGYDGANMNRYDDEEHCLTTFEEMSAARQACVENELDELENDANLLHCRAAMGRQPCN